MIISLKLSVTSKINVNGELAKVRCDGFRKFAAHEWWKLISPFTPMKTGNLMEDVTIKPYEIEYNAPYAHQMYEWNGKFNNLHPLSSRQWDKAAEPTQKPKLIQAMQNYVDSGKLG